MDRLSLPLAVVLAFEAVPAAAADRDDPGASPIRSPSTEQKSPPLASTDWQGFPNKGLRVSIRCPKRTWKRVAANTYLELFANRWRDQPEPASASELQKVRIQTDVAALYPSRKYRSVPEAGFAEVYALIGADGHVVEAYVTCSTDTDFHDVAMTAVRKSAYAPALVAGEPVASIVRRPYLFIKANH